MNSVQDVGKNGQQIAGDHPPGPVPADKIIGGQAVEVDAQAGRVPGSQALGQKPADEPGEHVPRAAAGQGRIARGVEADAAIGGGHQGLGPFQHQGDAEFGRGLPGQFQAPGLHFRDGEPHQPGHLPGVGGQEPGARGVLQTSGIRGQVVDAVGVDDHGLRQVMHQPADQFPGLRVGAQPRPQGQGKFLRPETPGWAPKAVFPKARVPTASGRGTVMASVSFTSRISLRLAGIPRVTSPAPARSAASEPGWRPRSCPRSRPGPAGGRRSPCCCRKAGAAQAPAGPGPRPVQAARPGREPAGC